MNIQLDRAGITVFRDIASLQPARQVNAVVRRGPHVQSLDDAIRAIRGTVWEARDEAEKFLVRGAQVLELVPYLSDPDWKVRLIVTRALAQLPGPSSQIADLLRQRLEGEEDKWVRNNLNWGIRCHGGVAMSPVCGACGADLERGLARCGCCGAVRPEFRGHERVVVHQLGCCVESGAVSDVRLPNGDYIWAEYFLDFVAAGWLDELYNYSESCFRVRPDKRARLTKGSS
jgi:hypothetical protein